MKHLRLLSALLVWLPFGLLAEPFTYESPAELSAALDANDDGLADVVLVNKATGVRQLAIQQPDGSIIWAEPRSTGLDGVTALTVGRFTTLFSEGSPHPAASREGFAVAAPGWNRVTVVPDPGDPEAHLYAVAPGLGPNLVVALDLNGDAGLDDLAIATCLEDPPGSSRLYASAWNGITASNLYDPVESQSGPLTHGNRAWLSSDSPLLVGMMHSTGATSDFITRIPGTLGYDVGPAVTALPPDATWVWGEFDASGYSQFLFYVPGASNLWVRPVEEGTPGVLTFGSGASFDLGQPIQQVCVLPQTTGALLLIVFGGGLTAGIYDFDGTNAPVLRQTLDAPLGNLFSLAGPLGDGNVLLLHGPDGGAGTSTGWQRWNLDGSQHTLAADGSLPVSTPAGGRANVLVYNNDPGLNPDAAPQLLLQAGDWSVEATAPDRGFTVTHQSFIDSATGLGYPGSTDFSRAFDGFLDYDYLLSEVVVVVNQRSASASVSCVGPPLGKLMGDIAFNPPPGVYPPVAAGGVTVRITATADGPIHFRTDPSQPWTLYVAASPPLISSNTTIWAYADNPTSFGYYDYADYSGHRADIDRYTPIRAATYRIAAVPALVPAPQIDANGDGMGDAWATAFGITDPLADPDGDGVNNRDEFAGGSDPLDPASVPTASVTHTLTYLADEHGTIDGPTPQTVEPGADGTAVTANPAACYHFARWSDGSTANPRLDPNVTADLTVSAEFALDTYTLTYLSGSGGSVVGLTPQTVACGGDGTAVSATPEPGYRFSQWSDASTANPRTDTDVTADVAVTALFQDAAAVAPRGAFLARVDGAAVASGRGWWDLTGSYTAMIADNPLVLNLVHDHTGKLTGTATYTLAKATVVTMPVKGSVKGSSGSITMAGTLRGTDAARTVEVSLALALTVDSANRQLLGRMTGSIRNGVAATPVSEALTLAIPVPMDGTWTLQFQLDSAGRRVTGTALLILSNGVDYAFMVQGRTSGTNAVLSLAGNPADPASKAFSIRTTITPLEGGGARIERFSAKGYGQSLLW